MNNLRHYRPYEQFTWFGVNLTMWITKDASRQPWGDLPVKNRFNSYYVIAATGSNSILGEGRYYEEVLENYMKGLVYG